MATPRDTRSAPVGSFDPLRKALFRRLPIALIHHLRSIAYDQGLLRIAHYGRREAAVELLRHAGRDIRARQVDETSWSAIGTKPAVPE
jgi:hypothetical protein